MEWEIRVASCEMEDQGGFVCVGRSGWLHVNWAL